MKSFYFNTGVDVILESKNKWPHLRLDLSIIDGKIRRTWHQQVTEFVEILTDQVVWKQCGKNFVEQIEIKKWKHERDIDSVMWMLLLFIFDA
jgi:hypothetical protein